jgi:hypothetical protein
VNRLEEHRQNQLGIQLQQAWQAGDEADIQAGIQALITAAGPGADLVSVALLICRWTGSDPFELLTEAERSVAEAGG